MNLKTYSTVCAVSFRLVSKGIRVPAFEFILYHTPHALCLVFFCFLYVHNIGRLSRSFNNKYYTLINCVNLYHTYHLIKYSIKAKSFLSGYQNPTLSKTNIFPIQTKHYPNSNLFQPGECSILN